MGVHNFIKVSTLNVFENYTPFEEFCITFLYSSSILKIIFISCLENLE